MIFKRYEIKYLLNREQYRQIRDTMDGFMISDRYGHSTIKSLYLDTPDFLLARRSLEKPLYKEKLRLRSYGNTTADSPVFVEIKKKYDSVVYKRRISMTEAEAREYVHSHKIENYSQISREISYFMEHYGNQDCFCHAFMAGAFAERKPHLQNILFQIWNCLPDDALQPADSGLCLPYQ